MILWLIWNREFKMNLCFQSMNFSFFSGDTHTHIQDENIFLIIQSVEFSLCLAQIRCDRKQTEEVNLIFTNPLNPMILASVINLYRSGVSVYRFLMFSFIGVAWSVRYSIDKHRLWPLLPPPLLFSDQIWYVTLDRRGRFDIWDCNGLSSSTNMTNGKSKKKKNRKLFRFFSVDGETGSWHYSLYVIGFFLAHSFRSSNRISSSLSRIGEFNRREFLFDRIVKLLLCSSNFFVFKMIG